MLRDGSTPSDPRLGRCVQFDDRSRDWPVRAVMGPSADPRTRMWYLPSDAWVFDQGQQGSCVGMGVTNELRYTPRVVNGVNERFAVEQIYWAAQRIDPWDGGSYPGAAPTYEGTSVLAGVKAAADLGYYREYRWAFSEEDLALTVSHIGPAVLGLPWHEGMFHPDGGWYLRPVGAVAGGHCVLACGLNLAGGFYTVMNSWGSSWGNRGRARILRTDMARLLANQGEAVVITKRAKPNRART